MISTPRRTLVVGGSGMLRGLCEELARREENVVVLARPGPRLSSLVEAHPQRIAGLGVDYRNAVGLSAALDGEVARRGPFDRAVLWVHEGAPHVVGSVAERLVGPPRRGEILEVLGSAEGDPTDGRPPPQDQGGGPLRRDVILGCVATPTGFRWLTDEEISRGVVRALDGDLLRTVVGTLGPWTGR